MSSVLFSRSPTPRSHGMLSATEGCWCCRRIAPPAGNAWPQTTPRPLVRARVFERPGRSPPSFPATGAWLSTCGESHRLQFCQRPALGAGTAARFNPIATETNGHRQDGLSRLSWDTSLGSLGVGSGLPKATITESTDTGSCQGPWGTSAPKLIVVLGQIQSLGL